MGPRNLNFEICGIRYRQNGVNVRGINNATPALQPAILATHEVIMNNLTSRQEDRVRWNRIRLFRLPIRHVRGWGATSNNVSILKEASSGYFECRPQCATAGTLARSKRNGAL